MDWLKQKFFSWIEKTFKVSIVEPVVIANYDSEVKRLDELIQTMQRSFQEAMGAKSAFDTLQGFQAAEEFFAGFQKGMMVWLAYVNESDHPELQTLSRMVAFVEESTELVQSLGFEKEIILEIVEHVYSKELGEPYQEVGGVVTTLAGLCEAYEINLAHAGFNEYRRIMITRDKIREKIRNKPNFLARSSEKNQNG